MLDVTLFDLFIFIFWLCWVFTAAHGLSLVAASRGCSSLWCTGFSLQWLLLWKALEARASVVAAHGLGSFGSWDLERQLSSWGPWV